MVRACCAVFDCETCSHLTRGRCPGCLDGNLKIMRDGEEACGIYSCVTSKGLASCDQCSAVVCPYPKDVELVCPVRAHFEKDRCFKRKLTESYLSRQANKEEKSGAEPVSQKTMSRLGWYLFAIDAFLQNGVNLVSSQDIARKTGVNSWLVRKDLCHFGEFGRRSIGYDAAFLRGQLANILHLDEPRTVIWVGSARLADEISLVQRFSDHKCSISAILDADPARIGSRIAGVQVEPITELYETASRLQPSAAVISVPEDQAQEVADTLASAGVRAILNLTSAIIVAPPRVAMRNVDVVAELVALSHCCGKVLEHNGSAPPQPKKPK